jgi:hypothetical protein
VLDLVASEKGKQQREEGGAKSGCVKEKEDNRGGRLGGARSDGIKKNEDNSGGEGALDPMAPW